MITRLNEFRFCLSEIRQGSFASIGMVCLSQILQLSFALIRSSFRRCRFNSDCESCSVRRSLTSIRHVQSGFNGSACNVWNLTEKVRGLIKAVKVVELKILIVVKQNCSFWLVVSFSLTSF